MSEHAARIQAQTHDAASHTQCDHTCAHLAIARRQLYPSIFDGDTSRAVFSLHHMADLSGNTNTNATLVREVMFGETLREAKLCCKFRKLCSFRAFRNKQSESYVASSESYFRFEQSRLNCREVVLQVQKVMFVSSIPE